jgi:hypothetical protein
VLCRERSGASDIVSATGFMRQPVGALLGLSCCRAARERDPAGRNDDQGRAAVPGAVGTAVRWRERCDAGYRGHSGAVDAAMPGTVSAAMPGAVGTAVP